MYIYIYTRSANTTHLIVFAIVVLYYTGWKTTLAVGTIGAATLPVTIPLVVSSLGFTASGIVGGSVAASWMSASAIASGGGVAAGSAVAVLQSVGAAGLAVGTKIGLASAGGAIGAALGKVFRG